MTCNLLVTPWPALLTFAMRLWRRGNVVTKVQEQGSWRVQPARLHMFASPWSPEAIRAKLAGTMIPCKLQIKNFLSYGSPAQTIDFGPHHLICLSGKNGHGKSALLDALTWSLWGQARKLSGSTKADEGIVRLGATSMMVSLDFIAGGSLYRVRREYTYERGKGVAQLDFGIIDPATQKMRTLTDKTIRATQLKIDQTIGLDFDAFINSVFLRQGNSNEFSKKSPKDRKEVLANILGLHRYELLRKHALEKMREGSAQRVILTQQCDQLAAVTQDAPLRKEQLALLINRQIKLTDEERELQNKLADLGTKRKLVADRVHEYEKIQILADQQAQELRGTEELVAKKFEQWKSVTHQKYRGGFHKKKLLEEECAKLQATVVLRVKATERILQLKMDLQSVVQKLESDYAHQCQQHNKQYFAYEAQLAGIQAEEKAIAHQLTELTNLELHTKNELSTFKPKVPAQELQAILAAAEQHFDRRKRFYQIFATKGNLLAQEAKDLSQKLRMSSDSENPSCPLCEQNLSASRRRFLQTQFTKREQLVSHQLRRLTSVIAQLKEIVKEQHATLTIEKQQLEEVRRAEMAAENLQTSLDRLQQQIADVKLAHQKVLIRLQDATSTFAQAQQEKQLLESRAAVLLTENSEYTTKAHELQSAEQELEKLPYDTVRHEQVQQLLVSLQEESNFDQQLTGIRQEIKLLCKQLRTGRQAMASLLQQYEPAAVAIQELATLDRTAADLTSQVHQLLHEKEELAHQKGALEQECRHLDEQSKRLEKEKERLQMIEQDTADYQTLAHALGKDGIQGLFIEHILPEIEEEANSLLSKLTNNQAHLTIESVRDLKSGGVKETLDIKISDALGIRPYELFSGGEAFRIDFALRLAISKLLARRSGTSLQTLIIDEGFGSQDEEGLSRIMEALYAIQDEFAKIIIVSHLPTMQAQFPVHFYVTKTPRGSTIQVVEQG